MACDWLLVDGSSLIFRAYYGALASARASGRPGAGAIGGFLGRLAQLITDRRARRLVIADDWAWRPQWRVELIAGYKAHRVPEPVPAGLMCDLPVITQVLEHVGIDVVGVADHEAEDVIATLTRLAPGTVEIASGDRDLFALVQDPRVRVLYPERSGLTVIDEAEITRRYAIPGRRYADFAILRGDPSDGLPGLKGVGAVTAAAMIRRHGDIAGVLRDRPLRPPDRDYLQAALAVVRPVDDLPIALPPGRRDVYPTNDPTLRSLAARHHAEDSVDRLLRALNNLAAQPARPQHTPTTPA
ncbi:MAG: flap endonuclease [Solirubrobacteraceae bacterium]|jgi:5'-3' exonuclease